MIKEIIIKCGGIAAFARRFNIKYRTAQSWYDGSSNPIQGIEDLIVFAYEHEYFCSEFLNKKGIKE